MCPADNPKSTPSSRSKKPPQVHPDTDVVMGEAAPRQPAEDPDRDEEMADHSAGDDEGADDDERYGEGDYDRDDDDEDDDDDDEDDDEDDVFDGNYLGGSGANLSSTLRALSGLVSGISSRLREILENLRQKDDPSAQLVALQSLAELLLVSTEDNLSGHFSPDQFVKELVSLMQDQGPYGENPEMMLLACRCIANLMEALPPATANVVYGGAVPVLCAKLMEIQYIDLAEQALSVSPNEFSSVEPESVLTEPAFPPDPGENLGRVSHIDREGGRLDCVLDLLGLLRYQCPADRRHDCCELLPQHPGRLFWNRQRRHGHPSRRPEEQRPKGG